jgi:hypothetical protein
MPIFPVTRTPTGYARTGEVLHEGRVLGIDSRDSRIMSDVYTLTHTAIVWSAELRAPISVFLKNFDFDEAAEAEVDATQEVVDAYEAWKVAEAEKKAQAAYDLRCDQARERLLEPKVGYRAVVVKGRKVPVGTEGIVTYIKYGAWGLRVGIKDDEGEVHYTAAHNVHRVVHLEDGEDWIATECRLEVSPPRKWDLIRTRDSGIEGTVFFVSVDGDRIGFATTNRKVMGRYVDVEWAYTPNVDVIERRNGQEPPFVNVTEPQQAKDRVVAPF